MGQIGQGKSDEVRAEGGVSAGSTLGSIQATDLLDALRALGADVAALAAGAGLGERELRDPEARIDSARVLDLFDRAAGALRDPQVGLHAGARATTRGPLFYLLLSSSHLDEGLKRYARYARITLDTQDVRITHADGIVSMIIDPGDPAVAEHRHACDYLMGAILTTLRRAVPRFQPLGVELMHEKFGAEGEAERAFGCPVRFNRRHNVLRFAASMLHTAPSGANAAIARQLEHYAASLLSHVDSVAIDERVAAAVRRLLMEGLRPDRPAVARRLNMSQRTLHRQLQEAGTSFKTVRDGVLAETSRALLSNASLKVEAVGRSLGFSEASAFSKA
ncbi:MAG TPA: AraC family transcriptional regulator ligand-binding domain-containing protein, partial [Candidatus Polarisedimenticolia bacterium]|nr:AraC family transcriptional regulator ligand-binding domain-containing protein [Candidatus Polarisedimenticolia bacterium]